MSIFVQTRNVKAIIIDDEKAAREATRLMLETFCSNVNVLHEFNNVDDGAAFLNSNEIDLVFLDIEMPNKNGFELFNLTDSSKFQVIFTTGHNEYAIKAFKHAACHYLLKPIIPDELINACKIAQERLATGIELNQIKYLKEILKSNQHYPENLVVSVRNGYEILPVNGIKRFEGERNYTWVHTEEGNYLTPKSIKEFEEILNPDQFYRAHQSHLVNRSFLKKIINKGSSNLQFNDGAIVPLSRHRKKDFLGWLEKNIT